MQHLHKRHGEQVQMNAYADKSCNFQNDKLFRLFACLRRVEDIQNAYETLVERT
jgi:hypothetical protein